MKRTYFPGITDIVVVTDPVEREELRRKIAAHTPNARAHATAIPGLTAELHRVLAIPRCLSPASTSSFKGGSA
jgi:hypothetical protein